MSSSSITGAISTPRLQKLFPHVFSLTMVFCSDSLTSPDGSVFFSFTHNVCGRNIYAEGTVDAALFLAKKIREDSQQKVFNMVDVLREGAMR